MSMIAVSDKTVPIAARRALQPFFVQEYLRIMRSRVAILIWLMIGYGLLIVPVMLERPQPELLLALTTWLGGEAIQSKLALFVWVDAAMNKFAVIMGPALAGGIIVEERARGSYDLLASKPIAAADYFTVKLGAAAAAFATFYLAGALGALLTFPWRVAGFDARAFLALSAVHLFAGLFAVSFSGVVATVFRDKLTGMLISVSILGTLVGIAFLGFYYPAFWTVSYLNPFFDGIVLIGRVGNLGPWDAVFPILLLVVFNLAFAALGRRRAAALIEDGERVSRRGGTEIRSAIGRPQRSARDQTPFVSLLRVELGRAIGRRHLVALAALCLMGLVLAFWLPIFPASIKRFFENIFDLEGWPAIVVANDFAGLLFFVYWIGVFDVLAVYVVPLEQRQLDLFLSKPLTRRQYLMARLVPVVAVMTGLGVVTAAASWLALPVAGLAYDPLAYAGAAAVVVAYAVALVCLVNLAVLHARETYTALLIAFVPMAAALLPGMFYMYRPDLFAPLIRTLAVFPLNLVWYPDFSRQWGLPLAALLLVLAAGLIAAAGRRIERQDVG